MIWSEELPGKPGSMAYSSIRTQDLQAGEALEKRFLNLDGSVEVTAHPEVSYATLVEGFNPVPKPITFPNGRNLSSR